MLFWLNGHSCRSSRSTPSSLLPSLGLLLGSIIVRCLIVKSNPFHTATWCRPSMAQCSKTVNMFICKQGQCYICFFCVFLWCTCGTAAYNFPRKSDFILIHSYMRYTLFFGGVLMWNKTLNKCCHT